MTTLRLLLQAILHPDAMYVMGLRGAQERAPRVFFNWGRHQ